MKRGVGGWAERAGHASTTGIPNLDYFVSYKPFERKDAQQFYSEKLVTLSDFSYYYKARR